MFCCISYITTAGSQILACYKLHKQTGMEAIERLRFLASFGPPSTSKRKGGEKTQPFNCFHSHPGIDEISTNIY